MSDLLSLNEEIDRAKNLTPANTLIHNLTVDALNKIADEIDVKNFTDNMARNTSPAPIAATASLTFVLFYGIVKCEPNDVGWIYDEDAWGIGASATYSAGFIYTAYDNWDNFFHNTTAFHVQGNSEGGGIYQINWFNKRGIPIGQYNGAARGIENFEAGGSGQWKRT